MKTTARNQFHGTVRSVNSAPVSAQVVLALAGGVEIVATMTRASAERLQPRQGQAVVGLIKASAVALVTDFNGYRLSTRNQLAGKAPRVDRGAVSSLVVLDVGADLRGSGSVTNNAVDDLGLSVGKAVTAVFKAYAVIVGVKP